MKKKNYWKELLKQFPELHFISWLTLLPIHDDKGNAVKCCNPIVHLKMEDLVQLDIRLKELGHKFIDSTVWYPAGQYFPREHVDRAIGFDLGEIKP